MPWAVYAHPTTEHTAVETPVSPGASMVGSRFFFFFAPVISIFFVEKQVLIGRFRLGGPFSRRQF